jgi:DNA-binding CsgD family transcriptional regulator
MGPAGGGPRMTGVLDTIEAVYELHADDPEWLQRIVTSAQSWLDAGLGVLAWDFDAATDDVKVGTIAFTGMTASDARVPTTGASELRASNAAAYRRAGPCSTVSDTFGGTVPGSWKALYPPSVEDFVAVFGRAPDHRGVVLGAPLGAAGTVRGRRRLLSSVAVHLGAACRLREALGETRRAPLESDLLEAVLSPTGECLEARGEATSRTARQRLQEMATTVDRARGKLRKTDPAEALSLWRGLVSGRWSLIDTFDTDGRRYLVAFRNDPNVVDPRALTLRERQVTYLASVGYPNKLVAYALGISPAAVSLHLKHAMLKLGLGHRSELGALFGDHGATERGRGATVAKLGRSRSV